MSLRERAQNEQIFIALNEPLRASEKERKELRALLDNVLAEADRLLDSVNNLSGWIDGNAGECETHGPAITKLRALLGKESDA